MHQTAHDQTTSWIAGLLFLNHIHSDLFANNLHIIDLYIATNLINIPFIYVLINY